MSGQQSISVKKYISVVICAVININFCLIINRNQKKMGSTRCLVRSKNQPFSGEKVKTSLYLRIYQKYLLPCGNYKKQPLAGEMEIGVRRNKKIVGNNYWMTVWKPWIQTLADCCMPVLSWVSLCLMISIGNLVFTFRLALAVKFIDFAALLVDAIPGLLATLVYLTLSHYHNFLIPLVD